MNSSFDLRSIDGYDICRTDNPELENRLFALMRYPDDRSQALPIRVQDPELGHMFEIVLVRLKSLIADSQHSEILHFGGITSTDQTVNGWFERNASSEKIGEIRVLLQS